MEIISHRGYWIDPKEKNTISAFQRSFSMGFGTETDLRDLNGKIVISHDMPRSSDNPLLFSDFLRLYSESGCSGILALNVKSDGLQIEVANLIRQHDTQRYVLFDMSVPDQLLTKRTGLNYLTRMSDIEPVPCLLDQADGIWLDEFEDGWLTSSILDEVLHTKKKIFVVSPELHGRDHIKRWNLLKSYRKSDVVLCTDFPIEARTFFGGEFDQSDYF